MEVVAFQPLHLRRYVVVAEARYGILLIHAQSLRFRLRNHDEYVGKLCVGYGCGDAAEKE